MKRMRSWWLAAAACAVLAAALLLLDGKLIGIALLKSAGIPSTVLNASPCGIDELLEFGNVNGVGGCRERRTELARRLVRFYIVVAHGGDGVAIKLG